jgi:hypothetical protein
LAVPPSSPVELASIERPPCPQCGGQMMVARIQPHAPGIEERTYECAKMPLRGKAAGQEPLMREPHA